MPIVSINRDLLYQNLGKSYTDEEFDELCFQFGIEVDDIIDDPEKGITLKIEVGANRYDLLCLEGISRALNIFLGNVQIPNYQLVPPKLPKEYRIIVKPNTAKVRPYVVGAVLRNITFTQSVYNSFIDLQDKLHQNIARKRTLVAIGTHDLDTVDGPFTYDAQPPQKITFIPLNRSENIKADLLLEELSHDSHLREYVPIIKDKPFYPVIRDRHGVVLSLPPIINGNHSKITLKTQNVFIECTATDQIKAQIVLDTIVCMFSEYCEKPFTIEPVEVEYPNGEVISYPILESREVSTTSGFCNTIAGVEETGSSIAEYLTKMGVKASVTPDDGNKITVTVPPTRYDILHECDIAEDFAVAYGFDRLAKDMKMPQTSTIGSEFQINYLSDKIRLLISQNNYIETALSLCVLQADMGERLRVDLSKESWVKVGNPKTIDCEAVRNTLLPGLLKALAANKHVSLPLRLFEVSDVVVKDEDPESTKGVGARNERHLCAINYNVRGNVEIVQGLLDNVMLALKIPFSVDGVEGSYHLEGKDHPTFFPGWCADILVGKVEVGRIGLLHPEVLANFNLNNPATVLILSLEKLFSLSKL
ncbi:UNVERIFIED_CONTAM: hypothetical protein RMT77_017441 [Armadillidium vulgare]